MLPMCSFLLWFYTTHFVTDQSTKDGYAKSQFFFFYIMEERKEEWRIIKNLKLKRSIYSDTGKIRIVPCKEYIYFNISMGL